MRSIITTALVASLCLADDMPSVVQESKKLSFNRSNKADYRKDWEKLYSFSVVDFFITEKRPTGSDIELGPESVVVTPGYDKHQKEEPSECLICSAEDQEIAELESRIQYLEWRYGTI